MITKMLSSALVPVYYEPEAHVRHLDRRGDFKSHYPGDILVTKRGDTRDIFCVALGNDSRPWTWVLWSE